MKPDQHKLKATKKWKAKQNKLKPQPVPQEQEASQEDSSGSDSDRCSASHSLSQDNAVDPDHDLNHESKSEYVLDHASPADSSESEEQEVPYSEHAVKAMDGLFRSKKIKDPKSKRIVQLEESVIDEVKAVLDNTAGEKKEYGIAEEKPKEVEDINEWLDDLLG